MSSDLESKSIPPAAAAAEATPGAAPSGLQSAAEAPTEAQQTLFDALRRGDRDAFAQVIEQHQMLVFGYLRARLLQATDAEDLTQEVFLRCFTARERFSAGHDIRPWLIGIARNLLREHIRRVRQRKETGWTQLCLELDTLTESVADEPSDGLIHLPGCLDSLGDSARQAIELRYCSQMRLSEIGSRLSRSEGAAKLLMFRARQALKNCLDRKTKAEGDDG